MLVVQKSRRAALPTISVVILLNLIEQWLQGRGSRDVEILFKDVKQQLSWKKAPRAAALASVADLFLLLADVAPNGALPPAKLVTALQEAHKKEPVNFTSRPIMEWSEQMGGLIRMAFTKFVELTKEPQKTRTLSQALV